jgi:hypothetical protein
MPDFFLDSCLFLAYGYPHEHWHSGAVDFFNSNKIRYTGRRVKREIETRLRRRRQLYIDLMAHLGRGLPPSMFVSTILNANDIRHFRGILATIPAATIPEITAYFRDKAEITKKGVEEAFGKTNPELVQCRDDEEPCVVLIQTLIANRSDAEILVDAFCWSEAHPATFATLDTTDVVHNRPQVTAALKRYRLLEQTERLTLDIRHLGEIP